MAMRQQMMEIGGYVPDMEDCPPDLSDFPLNVLTAFDIFNLLPDSLIPRMEGKPYYRGKELSTLPLLFELHHITSPDEKLEIIKYINIIDAQARIDLNKK